ncbi:helix-turn-helix domain-containing protein [Catenulispora sp. MAP12-49]
MPGRECLLPQGDALARAFGCARVVYNDGLRRCAASGYRRYL